MKLSLFICNPGYIQTQPFISGAIISNMPNIFWIGLVVQVKNYKGNRAREVLGILEYC